MSHKTQESSSQTENQIPQFENFGEFCSYYIEIISKALPEDNGTYLLLLSDGEDGFSSMRGDADALGHTFTALLEHSFGNDRMNIVQILTTALFAYCLSNKEFFEFFDGLYNNMKEHFMKVEPKRKSSKKQLPS